MREHYKGKLTYAANWDEYKRTPFWTQLDYIGIDAYFPLTDARTPSLEQLKEGWEPWKANIAALAKRHERPVLFTEFGYRSIDYTARRPWEANRSDTGLNLQAQVHATQAILEEFWKEEWFAGGYVWKWFLAHETAGGWMIIDLPLKINRRKRTRRFLWDSLGGSYAGTQNHWKDHGSIT